MAAIKKVAVLGAGMMGSDIALSCALAGYEVLLKEVNADLARAGKERIAASLAKWSEKGRLELTASADVIMSRITPTGSFAGFENVDLVIEAIFEDLAVKEENYNLLDGVLTPDCIIASNTSSLPITKLGACFKNPRRRDRFLGMHFFSPAVIMKLVEVVRGEDTTIETVEAVVDFCLSIRKEPVKVADCAGFVVNRILGAINNEALRLHEEGVASPKDIDTAVRLGLGHPIGPFALMDQVSNDLNLKVFRTFVESYGDRFLPRPVLVRKVDAGHLGRKSGKGWFDYSKK